jgi:MFS family permease
MAEVSAASKKGIFYGWWVVVVCCFVFMTGGIMSYASTIFFPAMMKEMGWKPSDLSLVFSILMWLPIVFSPLAGLLADKIGCRKTLLAGICCFLASGLLMSTVSKVWHVILYFSVLTSLGQTLALSVAIQTLLRRWFMKKAGLVVSIQMVCSAIFQAIMFPTLNGLSMSMGFRPVIVKYVLITQIIAMVLVFLLIKETPEEMGLNMDGITDEEKNKFMAAIGGQMMKEKNNTLGEAIKTPQFWFWVVSYGLWLGVLMGFMGNVTTIGISYGYDPKSVGIIMTYFMAVSIVGRLMAGWLGDKLGKRNVLLVCAGATAVILLAGFFLVNSATSVTILYACLGLFIMAPMVLMFPWIGDLYGRTNMGKIMGIALGIGTVLVGAFPMLAGMIKTATNSYTPFFGVSAAAICLAFILIFLIRPTETQKNNMGLRK